MSRMRKAPQNRASAVTGPDVPVTDGYERKGRCPNNGLSHGLLVGTMLCLGLTLLGFASIANASDGSALNVSADANREATVSGTEPESLELSPPSTGRPPSPPEPTSDPAIITTTGTSGPRKLSVAPGNQSLLPEDHPAWLSAEPDYESQVHRLTVSSFPSVSQQELDPSLDEPLLSAVYEYLEDQIVDRDVSRGVPRGLRERVTTDYIRRNLLPDPDGYTAELQTSSGPMYQKWVRLEITPTQRAQLTEWYREAVQLQRVAALGVALLTILGLVGIIHLALRKRRGRARASAVRADGIAGAAEGLSHRAGDAVAQRDTNSGGRRLIGLFVGMVVVGGILLPLLVIGYRVVGSSRTVEYQMRPSETNRIFDSDVRAETGRLGEMANQQRRDERETLQRLQEERGVVPLPPQPDADVSTSASSNSTAPKAQALAGATGSAGAVVGDRADFEANSTNQTE